MKTPRYLHHCGNNVEVLYRFFRREWFGTYADTGKPFVDRGRAQFCVRMARDEIALREAESEELIRFRWEYDCDYLPENSGDPQWGDIDQANETAKLKSGEWEALVCFAEVPRKCQHCGNVVDGDWEVSAALGGIVVDIDDVHNYKREVERELASECGVI